MMDLLEKPAEMMPPHSIEAEQCLLASLMVCNGDPVVYAEVAGVIREESFFQTDHAIIYAALQDMHRKERKVDPVVLRDELRRRGVLEEVGGAAYLAQIINTVPSWLHYAEYANTVREKAALRDLIVLCGHTAQACYRPQREDVAGKLASKLSHGATDIAVRGSTAELKPLGEILVEIAHRKPDEVRRLMTGMYEIDDATGGIGCGEFSLVGGRPGMGKSAFIKQVILNMARAGVTCGVVSIEESNNKIGENVLANLSGVENNRIAYSRLSPVEEQSLQTVAQANRSLPVFVDDVSMKMEEIEASITKMVMKHGCKFIVVDYLQLIDIGDGGNETREVTQISKGLKALFKRLNVANLVACQLNRGGQSPEVRLPTLKDLRGSGGLEQDGDLILLLHREDYYRKNDDGYVPNHQLLTVIAKNKNNAGGQVPLYFAGAYQRVSDWNNGVGADPNRPRVRDPFHVPDMNF